MVIYNILTNSLSLGLIYALLGIGVYIAYRVLDIADLGAEGVFPLGSAITILMIALEVPPVIAILIAMAAGGIMGLATGLLHTKLRIPSLLAGIITMVACIPLSQLLNGLTNHVDGYSHIGDFVGSVTMRTTTTIYSFFRSFLGEWGIILTSAIGVGLVIALLYWFFGTEIGITIRATGKNKIMSRAQGINTDTRVITGLVISNAIVAVGGSLFAQFMLSSNSTFGQGTIVIGLASILLGEAIMLYGKQTFWLALISVVVGSFAYQVVINIAMRALPTGYLKIVQAVLFVLILCIPLIKRIVSDAIKKSKERKGLSNA